MLSGLYFIYIICSQASAGYGVGIGNDKCSVRSWWKRMGWLCLVAGVIKTLGVLLTDSRTDGGAEWLLLGAIVALVFGAAGGVLGWSYGRLKRPNTAKLEEEPSTQQRAEKSPGIPWLYVCYPDQAAFGPYPLEDVRKHCKAGKISNEALFNAVGAQTWHKTPEQALGIDHKADRSDVLRLAGCTAWFLLCLLFGISKMVTWSVEPPNNLPVLVCEENGKFFAPLALAYDTRSFYAHHPDTGQLINVQTDEVERLKPAGSVFLTLKTYSDCKAQGYKADSKHAQFFVQEGNVFVSLLRSVGMKKDPWTSDGRWRELTRTEKL